MRPGRALVGSPSVIWMVNRWSLRGRPGKPVDNKDGAGLQRGPGALLVIRKYYRVYHAQSPLPPLPAWAHSYGLLVSTSRIIVWE